MSASILSALVHLSTLAPQDQINNDLSQLEEICYTGVRVQFGILREHGSGRVEAHSVTFLPRDADVSQVIGPTPDVHPAGPASFNAWVSGGVTGYRQPDLLGSL